MVVISPANTHKPVLTKVSPATRALGSCTRWHPNHRIILVGNFIRIAFGYRFEVNRYSLIAILSLKTGCCVPTALISDSGNPTKLAFLYTRVKHSPLSAVSELLLHVSYRPKIPALSGFTDSLASHHRFFNRPPYLSVWKSRLAY